VANAGVRVVLHERRPHGDEAHRTEGLAEKLVCLQLLPIRWTRPTMQVGLLHFAEMRRLGLADHALGDANQVPAGGALAGARDGSRP